MIREILFRGKPIDEETIIGDDFYYGDLCHYANGEVTIRQPETGYEMAVVPETIGQFTGLKTANKQDLFEGDIFNYSKHKGYLYDDFQGEIKFQDGCFGFKIITGQVYQDFTPFSEIDELQNDFLNHIEIVGRCGS